MFSGAKEIAWHETRLIATKNAADSANYITF
jgi:hypothetical protein